MNNFGPPEASWSSFLGLLGPSGVSGGLLGPPWGAFGGLLGRSWAPFWPPGGPFGRLLGPSGASWGLPWPPGAPQEAQKARKNDNKHEKSCILRVFSLKISPNPRFGCIFDPKNAAKSSENVFFRAETLYFTRVPGCVFTFFEASEARNRVFYVFSAFAKLKNARNLTQHEPQTVSPRGPKPA